MSNDKKNQPSPNTNTGNRTLTEDRSNSKNHDYSESNNRNSWLEVLNTLPSPDPLPKRDDNGSSGS